MITPDPEIGALIDTNTNRKISSGLERSVSAVLMRLPATDEQEFTASGLGPVSDGSDTENENKLSRYVTGGACLKHQPLAWPSCSGILIF